MKGDERDERNEHGRGGLVVDPTMPSLTLRAEEFNDKRQYRKSAQIGVSYALGNSTNMSRSILVS